MQKSVRTMVGTCNVDESEVECENGHNPAIDTGTWGNIRICEHSFDIVGINFDDEVLYADDIESECTKCTIEAIKFKLGL
jgi:hypothetical protein